eukprot:775656-Rhodomonas_salina.2
MHRKIGEVKAELQTLEQPSVLPTNWKTTTNSTQVHPVAMASMANADGRFLRRKRARSATVAAGKRELSSTGVSVLEISTGSQVMGAVEA